MKEVLYKISGSKFLNNICRDTSSIEELDRDRKISGDNFDGKRRFLFKHKETNTGFEK